MEIRKAERKKAKLRLGIAAPSGAGKTYSALLLAFGLGGKVGLIDTEHGSGDLYAHLGDYDIIGIEAPYTVAKYLQAIKAFEQAGYNVVIIDSLSHAWAGDGGLLDKQGKIADSGKQNGFAAWRTITPEHNSLVEAMLRSPCHIIATMRAKQEYVLETGANGKQTPKKVGLAPVQRDGMEYEFTVMLDVDMNHVASASKDRTGLFDGAYFKVTPETGTKLLGWLDTGTPPEVFDDAVFEGNQVAMLDASTLDELQAAFAVAYKYAKRFNDAEALTAATTVYNGRKAELTEEHA
ncbi:ATP-binding protein [Pseudoduganella chitinolytica]|uniref:ATP-binding protein n=1 Tax=Pseudoduganella chitinolytica TaxID=34070 RepID=A0ABY8BG63_9BURK|nr:ATP-binding protein [Pseudoduganella chitinolytica]WEF34902.1 ATP-binding protein [Pseudoduganella chitinolytica]